MSTINKIIETVKQLSRDKKNKKELTEFVEGIDSEKLESLVSTKLVSSSGPEILDALLTGISDTQQKQPKKLKVIQTLLKSLKCPDAPPSCVRSLLTRVLLEMPKLHSDSLATIAADCVDTIRDNSDPNHACWKDILPECLRLLSERSGSLHYCGSEMKAEEYTTQCVRSLCHVPWQSSLVIPLAAMFREIRLSKEEHLQVVNKLCCDLERLTPESLPPLLHQLLRLCKEYNSTVVFFRLSEYFTSRLYPELQPKDGTFQESESPDLDFGGVECPDDATRRAHATCILFAGGDSCLPRHTLNTLKIAAKRPATLLASPLLLQLLLAAEQQRDTCLQIIKSTLMYNYLEKQRRAEFTWCANILPESVDTDLLIKTLVQSSTEHCHMTAPGLLQLSIALLTCWNSAQALTPQPFRELRRLGRFLLVRLGRTCPQALGQALKTLGHTPRLIVDTLESLCINAAPMMCECIPELRSIVEECLGAPQDLQGEGDTALWRGQILTALTPITVRSGALRDTYIIMCRKGLFSRDPSVGRVSVTGFLSLLRALRCGGESLSQDRTSSNHSVLTQISIDVHSSNSGSRSRVNNAAVCMEIVSLLRKCLNQSWEVREQLYRGLPATLCKRPELMEPILELLHEHLTSRFLAPASESTPPLLFDKCVSIRDENVNLLEPLGALLFSLQKMLVWGDRDSAEEMTENGSFGLKLLDMLHLIAGRMANCNPVHFQLDDGVCLNDILPESQSRCLVMQQLLQVCEALQAFCLGRWALWKEPTLAPTLLGLHRTHSQLIDFVKTSKTKKLPEKTGNKRSQKDKANDAEKTVSKGKKGRKGPLKLSDMSKDRGTGFKPLDTVWDIETVLKMVQLLYSEDLEWASREDTTQVRTNRQLHRQVVKAATCVIKSGGPNLSPGLVTAVSKVLYKRCISRLDDFSDFDQETALLVTECFYELLQTVSGENSDRLLSFLTEIVETESTDLSVHISAIAEVLAEQVMKSAEGCGDSEDPCATRIPPALLRVIAALLAALPPNTPQCDKWTEWLTRISSDGLKSKWVGATAVPAALSLSARSGNPWTIAELLLDALTKIMGTNEDDTNETTTLEYEGPFSCLAHSNTAATAAFLSLCSHLNRRIGAVELVTGRLKAELQAVLPYRSVQHQQVVRAALKNRERGLCAELCRLCVACRRVAFLLTPAGACCTSALKLLARLHCALASLSSHFSQRDPAALLSARFDRVVKSAGRPLSRGCDALIGHAEVARSGVKDKSGGDRGKVLQDTKFIPKLVYEMEQFGKRVMQLSNKTKLDLMSHLSKGNARDFRIKVSAVREALQNQRGAADNDETTMDNEESVVHNKSNEDGDGMMVPETEENEESVEADIEAAIDEAEFEDSDNDDGGTSKRGSDDDTSTNIGSEDEDSARPNKKKRLS